MPGGEPAPAMPSISNTFDTRPSDTPNTAARAAPPWTSRWWCSTDGPSGTANGTGSASTGQGYRRRAPPPVPVSSGSMAAPAPPTRYEVDLDALGTALGGQPAYRTKQVWDGLYQQLATPEEMTNLPKALRAALDLELPAALDLTTESTSDGG